MIDREARDELAVLLRRLVAGRITNDDFDNRVRRSADRGVRAVGEHAWCLYDDHRTYRLTGRHQLPQAARQEIARWIAFLYSDLEYDWPERSFYQIYNWPMNLLTLGWWERRKALEFARFRAAGEFEVRPFLSRAEFETALRSPRLLTGAA